MDMTHQIWISAEPFQVYKALSTQEGFSSWWTTDVVGVFKKGETFTFGFDEHTYWMQFRVIEFQKDLKVVLECVDADISSKNDWKDTLLTFYLRKEGEVTVVELTHSGWKKDSPVFSLCNTTWGHLMFSLKNYVEKGTGNPM